MALAPLVISERSWAFGSLESAGNPDVSHFHEVTKDIFRGGRPEGKGLTDLAQMGVKTIIDLEDDAQATSQERLDAARLRLRWIPAPMSMSATPNDRQVSQVLQTLQDSRLFPIYVHCLHGEDRTGLIIALYRVLVQRQTPAQARTEMLADEFHPKFTALDQYFRAKTGFRGQ